MKKLNSALTTTLIVLPSVQYSMNFNRVDSPAGSANHSLSSPASLETQSQSEVSRAKEDSKRRYEEALQNELKRLALKYHLMNLHEAVLKHETEIRIWMGFGLVTTSCFILKQRNGGRKALYAGPRVIGGKAALDAKGDVLINTSVLDAPRSGWEEFGKFLKERGIDFPIRLSVDEKQIAYPDMRMIVIEIKSGKEYSVVYFSTLTESEDGQKAFKVCRRIEQEFGIKMGC